MCDSNREGRLKVLSQPGKVHPMVLYSDGNLSLGAGENGVTGVLTSLPSFEESSCDR